jgi:hypothetical protein
MRNICYITKETIHVCSTIVQCTSEILYFSVKFYRKLVNLVRVILLKRLQCGYWTAFSLKDFGLPMFWGFRRVNICVMLEGKKQTVFCTNSRELVNNSLERG